MPWLIPFIVGWWGTTWWPGIEVDAPPKGPLPEPWWWRIAVGIAGGGAAILVLGASRAFSDPMPGLVVALATGGVVRGVLAPLRNLSRTR